MNAVQAAQELDAAEFKSLVEPLTREARGVLLAVSGGPDSVAMMRLMAGAGYPGETLAVATVDHRLREGSRSEAEQVGFWARALGLRHAILTWEGDKPKTALQEEAREARYDLLARYAQEIGLSHLATAHTLDDQAETVLFRMARGSGLKGLAGMRPSTLRNKIVHVRPLLGTPKLRLLSTCRTQGWPFLEDPSNEDVRFARVRFRRILPKLAAEGLGANRFATLSARLARADEALDAKALEVRTAALVESGTTHQAYDSERLAREPLEILCRILAFAVDELDPSEGHAVRLDRLEQLSKACQAALRERTPFKRTLHGAIISTDPRGRLRLEREPERKRGRQE